MNNMMQDVVAATLPLSPEQRWVLSGLEDREAVFLHIELHGELNPHRLKDAFDRVMAGHDALNQAFVVIPGYRGLRQQPLEGASKATWEARDLRGQAELALQLEHGLSDARKTRFDLAQGHVLHATLLHVADTQWHFVLVASPLVADRGSMATLYAELAMAYQTGNVHQAETFQYSQFVQWRQELDTGEEAQQGRQYWSAHLADQSARQSPRLLYRTEAASPVSTQARLRRSSAHRPLDPHTILQIEQIACERNTTMELVLQAVWWVLLARVSGQHRFIAGWQHDCRRDYDALAGAVGIFDKVMPVSLNLPMEDTFSEWVNQLAQINDAHRNAQEYWPVDEPPESAHLEVGFAYASLPVECTQPLKWEVRELPGPAQVFELALQIQAGAGEGRAHASIHYAPIHYSDTAMCRLLNQYLVLLSTFAQNPMTGIAEPSFLAQSEREALLSINGAVLNCGTQTLSDLIGQWAVRTPEALALTHRDNTLSYAELDQQVNRLAHWLLKQGAGPERLVALNIERSAQLVIALLAVWRAGAAYLPLEPEWPSARRQRILLDAKPVLVLHGSNSHTAAVHGDPMGSCHHAHLDAIAAELVAMPTTQPSIEVSLQHAAYVLYTSGSTGEPKGVVIEHGQLLNYAVAMSREMELQNCQRWALSSTVAADLGNTALFGALLNGACLVVADAKDMQDGESFARFISSHAIDGLKIVPSHLEALLETESPILPHTLVLGGEAASVSFMERLAQINPHCRIFNHYGPTETTVGVMIHAVDPGNTRYGNVLPLTRVLPNCRIYVLDEAMNLAPTGAIGQLYIGGAQVCRGYLNRQVDGAFCDDPFMPGQRLYRSGDLASYLPEGAVRLLGRADNQIKVRGFRIEPGEVEAALLRQPGVRQAVVLPLHPAQGGTELVTYLVADSGYDSEQGRARMRAALAHDLPAAMLPSRFVFLAKVPRLANGKIDRRALQHHDAVAVAAPSVAPRDEIESVVVDCMARLLERNAIGIHDDFFGLGGHSLLAIKLVARIRKQLQIEIPPSVVFDHPSAAKLAEFVRTRTMAQVLPFPFKEPLKNIEARCFSAAGTGIPLYCFPGIYVDAADYAPIVDAVAPDRPVHGFICNWLTESRWHIKTIEELASTYAAYIRSTALDGRCAILGWSFGGNLAFETARQLKGTVEVQFVGLVDVCQSRDIQLFEQFSPQTTPQPQADQLVQAWLDGSSMKQQWLDLFAWMSASEKALVDQYLLATAETLPGDGPDAGSRESDLWRAFNQHCVMSRYTFKPVDAPLYVWTAAETAADETLILRDWLPLGNVRLTEMIPGATHRGIVRNRVFLSDLKKRVSSLDRTES